MQRKEFIGKVAEVLRANGSRKTVSFPKHVLHVSDDDGNSKDFTVKKSDRKYLYSADDIDKVLRACFEVIESAMRDGEDVSIHGFGTIGLKYRKARQAGNLCGGEKLEVPERFVPKFVPSRNLKLCAMAYGAKVLGSDMVEEFDGDDDDDVPEWVKNDGA